ncbi:XRE family transcriptional regulator, partial [Actinomadura sp. KC345]|uniref:helix-turn-helix domain-containing protein n=1 Tax=Actinomadura sp. KC345 TaxID=2530371 RepID=UPI0010454E70
MPSPYVRRRRLAAEIRKLRESRGLTTDGLAQLMYYSRTKISRLENAQGRPDLAEIINMLNILEITGSEFSARSIRTVGISEARSMVFGETRGQMARTRKGTWSPGRRGLAEDLSSARRAPRGDLSCHARR